MGVMTAPPPPRGQPGPMTRSDTLRPYSPSLRDKVAGFLAGDSAFGSIRNHMTRGLMGSAGLGTDGAGLIDYTPFGLPFQLEEAGGKIGAGHPVRGAVDVGLAALPIPGAAKGLVRRGAKAAVSMVERAGVREAEKAAPIIAYHGSPHTFDQFDLSKIGTGEGAQAYGHGLYFAENEGVAKQYRENLASDGFLTSGGQVWSPDALEHMNVKVAARSGDLDAALVRARGLLPTAPDATRGMLQRDIATLESLQAAGGVKPNPGSMYQVGIHADPEHFLDWDKPIAEQHPKVRAALDPIIERHAVGNRFGYPSAEIAAMAPERYNGLKAQAGDLAAEKDRIAQTPFPNFYESSALVPGEYRDPRAATEALQKAGLPGIKYLDGGSRKAGDGTRNFVVFDPKIVDIMKRYGVAAPVAAGILAGTVAAPREATAAPVQP